MSGHGDREEAAREAGWCWEDLVSREPRKEVWMRKDKEWPIVQRLLRAPWHGVGVWGEDCAVCVFLGWSLTDEKMCVWIFKDYQMEREGDIISRRSYLNKENWKWVLSVECRVILCMVGEMRLEKPWGISNALLKKRAGGKEWSCISLTKN